MSVRVMSWVWEHSRSEPTDRLVLLAIADCANDAGAEAYPSMATLAKKTGLAVRSVQRCLTRLSATGELVVHHNAGPKGCNRYRVTMTPATQSPPTESHPPDRESPRQSDTPPHGHHPPATQSPPPRPTVTPTPDPRSPEPSLNHPLTVSEPSVVRTVGFDEFWITYPRKAAKDAAKRAWAKAIKRAEPDRIIAGSVRYRDDPGREAQYTKYPATWLNDGCWDDEPLPRGSPNGRAEPSTAERKAQAALDAGREVQAMIDRKEITA